MRSDWRIVRLAELGRIVTGKTPPSAVEGCFGGSTPFITPSDYDGSKYIRCTARTLTARGEQAIGGARLPSNAVMVTCIGSDMGKVALSATEAFTNQQINSLIVESGDLPEYVYYNLSTRKKELRTSASGSAQPILNKSAFGATEIELPNPREQAAIVEMLRRLDDRIDLLRQTNATLESIAQALFKSWFIDFDPVRAKAEGREPEGMDAATAALFPAEFEESALGFVPKTWQLASVAALASLRGGKQLERSEFDDMAPNPIFGGAGEMGRTALANAEGFVLTVGRVGAYCGQFFWHEGPAWVNNNASLVRPHQPQDGYWLHQALLASDIDKIKKGAAQPFVSNSDIENLPIVVPGLSARVAFRAIAEPLYRRQTAIANSCRALRELRDTLLPRLISGNLRLPEAQAQLEEAIA